MVTRKRWSVNGSRFFYVEKHRKRRSLLWLRQREIVHYTRFKELFEYYEKQLNNNTNNLNTNNNNVNNQIMNGMPNNQLNSQYMNQYGQMM